MVLYFVALARARHVTAVSPYSAARVRRFTRAAVEVIPNGVEDDLFVDPVGARVTQTTESSAVVFLSINNGFSPRKNVTQLLEAFAIVRRSAPAALLHLVGADHERGGPCEAWSRARGLEAGVSFLGTVDRAELFHLMDGATALVHPAREENMPLTLIEAMARGIPVIGGRRSGGVPWVLDHGNAGLLVDVDDPGSIAGGMVALVDNAGLRARFALAGHAHARKNFSQSRVTDLYLAAYRRVLAETI